MQQIQKSKSIPKILDIVNIPNRLSNSITKNIPQNLSPLEYLDIVECVFDFNSNNSKKVLQSAHKILLKIKSDIPSDRLNQWNILTIQSLSYSPLKLSQFIASLGTKSVHQTHALTFIYYARLIACLIKYPNQYSIQIQDAFTQLSSTLQSESDLKLTEKDFIIVTNAILLYTNEYLNSGNIQTIENLADKYKHLAESFKSQSLIMQESITNIQTIKLHILYYKSQILGIHDSEMQWITIYNSHSFNWNYFGFHILLKSAIKSYQLKNINLKKLFKYWEEFKLAGFQPLLKDFHNILSVADYETSKSIFESLERSGHIPTSITYSLLFNSLKGCNDKGSVFSLEEQMISKGIEHTWESMLSLIIAFYDKGCFDEAEERYNQMMRNRIPTTVEFYNTWISKMSQNFDTSEFAIYHLRYMMKRDSHVKMNVDTCKFLLDCSIKCKNSEIAFQVWQICVDFGLVNESILSRMAKIWGHEKDQEMRIEFGIDVTD